MKAAITAIAAHLPSRRETIEELAASFPDWQPARIVAKTGIASRHVAASGECSSDLAVRAAERLLDGGICRREEIDFLLFCTQTPDYFLPTTACLIQQRLGLPTSVAALDFNLGCSGYIYGLSLAQALVESGQARNVLLLTADTYTKLVAPADRNVRTIFGDGAAATLIQAVPDSEAGVSGPLLGPFVLGTDGSGAENLIVREGAFRSPAPSVRAPEVRLEMNGPEIFNFTLRVVPACVTALLEKAGLAVTDIDLVIPHQANAFMLEHLRDKLQLPTEKFLIDMRDCGNTVCASIPVALDRAARAGRLKRDARLLLIGFGVGYSWGGCLFRWRGAA